MSEARDPKARLNDWLEEVDNSKLTSSELADKWIGRWVAADRSYISWSQRFKVPVLYSYYEGYQHLIEQDENNRQYVVNLIYSTIEQKLPNLLFDNPTFTLRPHPFGENFDLSSSIPATQLKEDTLNYITGRKDFSFGDKHELAILDSFFGFGVLEVDYSKEPVYNANINEANKDPLNNLYCKQIPFDTFRVASGANWDLSTGKWWGYYEFMPYSQLSKYIKEGKITKPNDGESQEYADFAQYPLVDGKMVIGESMLEIAPPGTIKVYHIEDFERGERLLICPDNAEGGDRLLEVEDFEVSNFSILRFGKRRRGWYPLPPVFQWLSPQDEINDIRQAQSIHRKRFSRKYGVTLNALDPDEKDKLLYGPDGTVVTFKQNVKDVFMPIDDAPLDSANQESMQVSYGDMDRVTGGTANLTPSPDRETATASQVTAQRAMIRESKEVTRVSNFLCDYARNVLRAIGQVPGSFWVPTKVPEGLLDEIKGTGMTWKKMSKTMFKDEDYDVDLQVSSISPVYQQQDQQAFLKFLAVITQYEILSISPGLLREAAYRLGYKNSSVLNQFQQLAQLAMIGKINQAKAAAAATGAPAIPSGPQPGQMAQNTVAQSTPPDLENIRNMIFGNNGNAPPK